MFLALIACWKGVATIWYRRLLVFFFYSFFLSCFFFMIKFVTGLNLHMNQKVGVKVYTWCITTVFVPVSNRMLKGRQQQFDTGDCWFFLFVRTRLNLSLYVYIKFCGSLFCFFGVYIKFCWCSFWIIEVYHTVHLVTNFRMCSDKFYSW